MKLKLQTLTGNHQFHYMTGKHKMFSVTVSARILALVLHGSVSEIN